MTEPCCRLCRSHLGVCRERRDCWCHREQAAIARDEDTNRPGRPPHPDPVGERVVNRDQKVRAQRKRRKREE